MGGKRELRERERVVCEREIYRGVVGGERHVGGGVCVTVAEARGGKEKRKKEKRVRERRNEGKWARL